MIENPEVVHTSEQQTALIRIVVPRDKIQTVMGPGIGELLAAVHAQGIGPTGPWLTHHLRVDPDDFDFEICVPVSAPVAPTGRVEPGVLRAATVVRTVYHGPYEGLGEAWGAFRTRIEADGHRAAGDLWERYLVGPETSSDPGAWRTELNQPLTE